MLLRQRCLYQIDRDIFFLFLKNIINLYKMYYNKQVDLEKSTKIGWR